MSDFPINLSSNPAAQGVYVRDSREQKFTKFQAGCTLWSASAVSAIPRGALVAPVPVRCGQDPRQMLWQTSSSERSASPSPPPQVAFADSKSAITLSPRKNRGPKQAVPEELKDDKYFKRRKRNNEAAKRSRRARKERQDVDLQRIASAELENASLKTQMLQLRAEYDTLVQVLIRRRQLQNDATALSFK